MSKPFIDEEKYVVSGELLNKNYEFVRQLHDYCDCYRVGAVTELGDNAVRIEANAQRIVEP